jgi:hypothetical protein
MLQILHAEKPGRFEHVAKCVKCLCADISPQRLPRTENSERSTLTPFEFEKLLPYVFNLKSLEFHGGFNITTMAVTRKTQSGKLQVLLLYFALQGW